MVNKISFFILALTVLYLGCKPSSNNVPSPPIDYISDNVPSEFLEFYERFHHDEVYQMEHIVFPLAGMRQDTTTMEMVAVKWQRENWLMHKEFNSHDGTYKRSFTNLQGIIIEKIEDIGGRFSMERRFSKLDDQWNLIFYSEFRLIQN